MEMVKLPFSGKQLSDAVVIKDACEDAFGSDKAAIVECISKLSLVEVLDQKLDSICHKTPFPNCFKYEKVRSMP